LIFFRRKRKRRKIVCVKRALKKTLVGCRVWVSSETKKNNFWTCKQGCFKYINTNFFLEGKKTDDHSKNVFFLRLNIKNAHPKPAITRGGDYIFVIKITFVGRTHMIVNSLKIIDLGASFEPYSMFIRQRKHSKKIKRIA